MGDTYSSSLYNCNRVTMSMETLIVNFSHCKDHGNVLEMINNL